MAKALTVAACDKMMLCPTRKGSAGLATDQIKAILDLIDLI
jgi:hypothetical protein